MQNHKSRGIEKQVATSSNLVHTMYCHTRLDESSSTQKNLHSDITSLRARFNPWVLIDGDSLMNTPQ